MYRQSKKLLTSNISSLCSHNMANFGPITCEIRSGVCGTPANFNGFRVLASLHDVAHRMPTKLCTIFGRLLGCYTMYTLLAALAPNGILPLQNSLCVQVLRSPILPALLHGTRAAAVSQTLWHGTRNAITELLQRAPSIFRWAAITLGIGPHSNYYWHVEN